MSNLIFRHRKHVVPRQVITWAGICPWTRTYCFGFEDGHVHISHRDRWNFGPSRRGAEFARAVEGPINAIAFQGPFAAISSRYEISVLRRSNLTKTHFAPVQVLKHLNGSHGVIGVDAIQAFAAPIGLNGLVQISRAKSDKLSVSLTQTEDGGLNFYKLACLTEENRTALIGAACRRDGIAAFWLTQGAKPSLISRHFFGRADIVDVVAVRHPRAPYGVIGLSKDGALVWIPNILGNEEPRTLSPKIGIGTAYSLLVVGGHGLVLSGENLSCLPGLTDALVENRELPSAFTLSFQGDELIPAPLASFFLLKDDHAKEFEIDPFLRDASSLGSVDPQWLNPQENLVLPDAMQSEVSLYDYSPAELEWSRKSDAIFATQLV